jgi:hypothetical protein
MNHLFVPCDDDELLEICALLGYYAAYSDNSAPTFRDNLSGPIFNDQEVQEVFLILKDGTDRLSRNVGAELSLYAA